MEPEGLAELLSSTDTAALSAELDSAQFVVARLEEDQRRCGLAIAPVAGPPPGFLSRFDVIHVVAQHRAAVVQRDQRTGRRPGLVPPRKRATGQKTRRQRLRERNAKIYGGLFVFVVALSLIHI